MELPLNLDIFLAHADDHTPFLREGLPRTAAAAAPSPETPPSPAHLASDGADPQSLHHQRWGIVAPEGPEGDRLIALIEPLRKHRQAQQNDHPVQIYRVPAKMNEQDTQSWIYRAYNASTANDADRPKYLLLLGDAEEISLDFQRLVAGHAYVGRLAFPSEDGYTAYVDKILTAERADLTDTAHALFYTARDKSRATEIGHEALTRPSFEHMDELKQRGDLLASDLLALDHDPSALFTHAARREPTMMFTISHGLGASKDGWSSATEQRALQGAMSLGDGHALTAEDFVKRPFLPGGIWFYFACYGAATPTESAYYPWLKRLRETGAYLEPAEKVLAGLPRPGDRPFIAALPQAALANPDGPLAVVGHADLAWTYGFMDVESTGAPAHPERFERVFRQLIAGGRAGVAHNTLAQDFTSTSVQLSIIDSQVERARAQGVVIPDDEPRIRTRSHLWMRLQDLAGYILLGDPAARLSIRARPGAAVPKVAHDTTGSEERRPLASSVLGFTPKPSLEAHIEAAEAMIAGNQAPNAIAARYGLQRADLDRLTAVYREAGREALKKLR